MNDARGPLNVDPRFQSVIYQLMKEEEAASGDATTFPTPPFALSLLHTIGLLPVVHPVSKKPLCCTGSREASALKEMRNGVGARVTESSSHCRQSSKQGGRGRGELVFSPSFPSLSFCVLLLFPKSAQYRNA